ncbi:MAG: HAD-superfamily hydrolase, subfamily variant 3 [Myxococcaceae bacterium]|nr:HAD-superfamily hydrolase, subfamily variant 3 [Myxococcaceae bacterium]
MTKSPITHAIFDLDGTLLDTESLYSEAARIVCSRHGGAYSLEIKRAVMGGDTLSGALHTIEALGLPIEPSRYIEERERELHLLLDRVVPMAGAVALVEGLRARNIPIAVATSGHRAITERKLQDQPFLHELSALVCGDDPRLQRPKPFPDIYLLAAGELAADPRTCLVIEDSLNGLRAGLAAGMRTVALVDRRWGFEPSLFAAAEQVVHDLTELKLTNFGL